MTKQEILEDGLNHFCGDVSRRCLAKDEPGACAYYYGNSDSKTAEGCWVGRLLPEETCRVLDEGYNNEGYYTVRAIDIIEIAEGKGLELPDWFTEDYNDFFNQCQALHDGSEYWTKTGLSEIGVGKVKSIIKNNNLELTNEIRKHFSTVRSN